MAATIKIKNSSTTGAVPTSGDLVQGELAVNVTDTGLYTENASGTVVKLNAPSIDDKNTGATKRMTIDTSGNIGVGVTPSAWSGSYKAGVLNLPGGNNLAVETSNQYDMIYNAYLTSGGWVRVNADYSSIFQQSSGAFTWYSAASGSAGSSPSFSAKMTLDASGNLGIGTTSPTSKLDVKAASGGCYLATSTASTANLIGYFGINNTAQAVEIESNSTFPLRFNTNGAERARIDSSGNLLVGTTSASSKLYVTDSSAPVNQSVYFDNTNASFASRVLSINASRNTTNGTYKFLSCSISAVAEKFYVFDSGSAYNSTGTYGTISDIKLKENIVDATPKLADVMRLQVRNFNFKTEPNEKQLGFVAQELEQVFPAMVQETQDKDENGELTGETTKQVKTTVLIPILVKAIQEQQAIINAQQAALETLTNRITALEQA